MRIAILLLICTFSASAALSDAERALLRDEMVPACRAEFDRQTSVPEYRISAVYDQATHTISGQMTLRVVNTSAQPWTRICLQTMPNAEVYRGARQSVDAARLDGATLEVLPKADGTAVAITLPQALAVGTATDLALEFTTVVSTTGGHHGLLNVRDDLLCLYSWYPDLALFADGEWQLHPVGENGDPTRSVSANVVATVTLPVAWQIAGTGALSSTPADAQQQVVTIVAPLARNVALVAGLGMEVLRAERNGITIASWFPSGNALAGGVVRDTAAQALVCYGSQFGPYPYRHFTAVAAPLGDNVGGMEASGCIINDSAPYLTIDEHGPMAFLLRMVTAHEVGHQWWYGIVGSDAWRAPWLDESLTNWTCTWFAEQELGEQEYLSAFQMLRMEAMMGAWAKLPVAAPIDAFADQRAYGGVVYGSGALAIEALRRELGDLRFFLFLRRYAEANRFGMADKAAWLRALSAEWTPEEAAAFMARWIDAPLTAAEVLPQPMKLPMRPQTTATPRP